MAGIFPKGVLGEPAYETGALIRNLWTDRYSISEPSGLLKRRIYQLAEELNIDRMRIRNWSVAQAVLSAWWGIEDNAGCEDETLAFAAMIVGIDVE